MLSPVLFYQALRGSRHTRGLLRRFGFDLPVLEQKPTIWVHGVSVGEVLAARPIVKALREQCPEYQICVSTSTSTGQDVAIKHYPDLPVFYFPLDFSWSVRWITEAVKPSLVVLIELELWPNFLRYVHAEQIPVAVVNGRISERSSRRYGYAPEFVKRMFLAVRHYLVQNQDYADRFVELGVPGENIQITGNIKYDSKPPPETENAAAIREQLGIASEVPVLIGGSTHPTEEAALLSCYQRLLEKLPDLRLILVPRHNERSGEIVKLIEERKFTPQLFSQLKQRVDGGEEISKPRSIIVVDVMGELARLYAVADVCFVGGSLIRHGGQNMLEPASLGKAVLVGPHCFNFKDTVDALRKDQAIIQVGDDEELFQQCEILLLQPSEARALGQKALETLERNRGATQQTVEGLLRILAETTPRINSGD